MKKTHIAVLIGAFAVATAQVFAQAEAPGTPVPNKSVRQFDPQFRRLRPPGATEPEVTWETRKLAIADIVNIRLNALSGSIQFTVAGVEYEYEPVSGSGDGYSQAAKAAACFGLLAELRKAETIFVSFAVQLPGQPADRKKVRLTELAIPIEKLR